jgi:hypothetical protein
MNTHRSLIKIAAIALAVSAALPALADTEVTTVEHVGKHHYVYYRDHDIYFAPDTNVYYWMENGRWQSGPVLPEHDRNFVAGRGIDIQLDTDRPFERNDYVVAHYRDGGPAQNETTTTTERSMAADGTTTTTTTTTKRRYVYYGDHDIYFAPDTKMYYWRNDGRWQSGTVLPAESQPYVRNGGFDIELDTDRPYERNDYVIAHYKHRHDNDGDRHNDD